MAGHDEWCTPPSLFKLLDSEFHFTLDAAANANNTLCPWHLTDALNQGWSTYCAEDDRVWCNPPYSGGNLPAFVARAWEQCQAQHNTMVMLIPAYTDPKYWWDIIVPHADEVRFLKGRVSFLENGAKKQSARFPSCVVVFRYRPGVQQKQAHCWWWDWKGVV